MLRRNGADLKVIQEQLGLVARDDRALLRRRSRIARVCDSDLDGRPQELLDEQLRDCALASSPTLERVG